MTLHVSNDNCEPRDITFTKTLDILEAFENCILHFLNHFGRTSYVYLSNGYTSTTDITMLQSHFLVEEMHENRDFFVRLCLRQKVVMRRTNHKLQESYLTSV